MDELSIYASTPFKFVIDGKAYYIHASLVSQHSHPLDRMINGSMAEAQKGFAVLEDVDEGTLARFIEWAYKGCYTAAKSHLETSSSPLPAEPSKEECEPTEYIPEASTTVFFGETPPEEEIDGWGSFGLRKKSKKLRMKSGRQHNFHQEVISIDSTRANLSANENYTEVFLSHARLYVFAEKYDIQLLAKLALKNLHDTLALYTLHRERSQDIVDLLGYVYANTSELPWSQENLRTVLKDYIGREMNTLMRSKEFRELIIKNGGPLLDDFVEMVIKRID